jgi:hypothetical protein
VERVLDQVVEQDRDVLVRRLRDGVAVPHEKELTAAFGCTRLPSFAGALGRTRERDRARRARLAALARERQQRRQKPREAFQLELGCSEVGLDLVAASSSIAPMRVTSFCMRLSLLRGRLLRVDDRLAAGA